jgi:heat shock protein HslJ
MMVLSRTHRAWMTAMLALMLVVGGFKNAAAQPAPAASAKLESDWSRLIGDLLPAIQACLTQPAVPVERVLKAWPMNDGMVGVRLRSPDGHRFDCIAPHTGGPAERLNGLMPEDAKMPGEGDPVFIPKRVSPPPVRVELLERVVDGAGAVQGWLSYARGGQNAPAPRLHGDWRLDGLGATGAVDPLKLPLTFATDGTLRGVAGCNRVNGTFTLEGDTLKIGRLATTRRACAKAVMAQERRYLDTLRRAAGWKIESEHLILTDANGATLMRLSPVLP